MNRPKLNGWLKPTLVLAFVVIGAGVAKAVFYPMTAGEKHAATCELKHDNHTKAITEIKADADESRLRLETLHINVVMIGEQLKIQDMVTLEELKKAVEQVRWERGP